MSLKTYKEKLFVLVAEMILNENCVFIINDAIKAELKNLEVNKNRILINLKVKKEE